MSEKKAKTQERFICCVDTSKSPTARQAYFFLKGLGSLRQDIIIDMVQRTLGEDLNLDLEHMTRGELMALYNKNVYTKQILMQTQTVPQPAAMTASPAPAQQMPIQNAAPAPVTKTKEPMVEDIGCEEEREREPVQEPADTEKKQDVSDLYDRHSEQPDRPTGFSRAKQPQSYNDDPIFEQEPEDVEDLVDDDLSDVEPSQELTDIINAGFSDI